MATKLLSLCLLAAAGLGVVRAAPFILDQRQGNLNGALSQQPSNQLGQVFDVTNFPVKRAAPLILDQRQSGTIPQQPDGNGTLPQQPGDGDGTIPQQPTGDGTLPQQPCVKRDMPLILDQRQSGTVPQQREDTLPPS